MSSRATEVTERKRMEAERVKKDLAGVACSLFSEVGVAEWLPFPGLRSSIVGDRPPREFNFVGRSEYPEIMKLILVNSEHAGLIITGTKGCGKSSILRAVAVDLFAHPDLPLEVRIICIWFFDARKAMLAQVRDSLIFAYSDAHPSVLDDIANIHTPEELSDFLLKRIEIEGDNILLLMDGQEKFDARGQRTPEEKQRRAAARAWLDVLENHASFTVKTLSAGANDVISAPARYRCYELKTPLFNEDEYCAFLEGTALGAMLKEHPLRIEDVQFLAGRHPMSLFLLDSACEAYAGPMEEDVTFRFGFAPRKRPPRPDRSKRPKQLGTYLDDNEDWKEVIARFKQADAFKLIKSQIQNYSGEVETLRIPASVFTGYIWEHRFCTEFLCSLHMEAALQKLGSRVFRSPAFQAYVKEKLAKPGITWPAIGWAIEGFVADAIMAVGLKFQGRKLKPGMLRGLDGNPEQLKPEEWSPNQIVYLLPGTHSFKYVDGLMAWKGEQGDVHMVALQVTCSPETHRKTEYKFMLRSQVARWYTGQVELHYVYVCLEPPTAKPKPTPTSDMVPYERHELPLSECFEDLGREEKTLLHGLGTLRYKEVGRRAQRKASLASAYDQRLKSLPPSKLAMYKLAKRRPGGARKWLVQEARKHGIQDPAERTIYELLIAMPA